ncbi:hypothetical protein BU16DRAFT_566212 [Lophium mytilinum]|uniref:ABC transporter domain-containing protein n=1 Tax=Lophium mytilinum TaxID=390894 RepID=A0A6A6QCQ9_9PEZI|nr:hypothetical protein BU16DRAFT_566212 [Lophium mytilinum]
MPVLGGDGKIKLGYPGRSEGLSAKNASVEKEAYNAEDKEVHLQDVENSASSTSSQHAHRQGWAGSDADKEAYTDAIPETLIEDIGKEYSTMSPAEKPASEAKSTVVFRSNNTQRGSKASSEKERVYSQAQRASAEKCQASEVKASRLPQTPSSDDESDEEDEQNDESHEAGLDSKVLDPEIPSRLPYQHVWAVIGMPGSGKSTFIEQIAGRCEIQRERVKFPSRAVRDDFHLHLSEMIAFFPFFQERDDRQRERHEETIWLLQDTLKKQQSAQDRAIEELRSEMEAREERQLRAYNESMRALQDIRQQHASHDRALGEVRDII